VPVEEPMVDNVTDRLPVVTGLPDASWRWIVMAEDKAFTLIDWPAPAV
jgi:hypothetical protein